MWIKMTAQYSSRCRFPVRYCWLSVVKFHPELSIYACPCIQTQNTHKTELIYVHLPKHVMKYTDSMPNGTRGHFSLFWYWFASPVSLNFFCTTELHFVVRERTLANLLLDLRTCSASNFRRFTEIKCHNAHGFIVLYSRRKLSI